MERTVEQDRKEFPGIALLALGQPVVDANGNPVPLPDHVAASADLRAFMASRVPAAECPHYIAKSEADAGFVRCERCPA